MGYIVSIILFGTGILIHRRRKSWISPDVFFCYQWGIISLLASLRLFGLYSASFRTWMVIFVGTLSFVTFINQVSLKHISEPMKENVDFVTLFKPTTFWIIIIILYVFSLRSFMQTIRLMISGITLDQIRLASFGITDIEGYVRQTGFFSEIFSTIRSAFSIIITAVGIQAFIINPRKYKTYFLAVFGLTMIKSFSSGGRFTIVYFTLELLACYTLYKRAGLDLGFSLSSKAKKTVRRIFIVSILLIIWLSILRGAETAELIRKYYRYLCGNVVFINVNLDRLESEHVWSFSFAGFYGLWHFILPLLNQFGITYPATYLVAVEKVMNTQQYERIGEHMYTNAFVTPYYHLYADFRWIGVILGMVIFAAITSKIYRKAKETLDVRYVVFYLTIIQMLFKTLQLYPLVSMDYVFTIVIMYLVCHFKIKLSPL